MTSRVLPQGRRHLMVISAAAAVLAGGSALAVHFASANEAGDGCHGAGSITGQDGSTRCPTLFLNGSRIPIEQYDQLTDQEKLQSFVVNDRIDFFDDEQAYRKAARMAQEGHPLPSRTERPAKP